MIAMARTRVMGAVTYSLGESGGIYPVVNIESDRVVHPSCLQTKVP
jgi:hypothetical protein